MLAVALFLCTARPKANMLCRR